MGHPLTNSQWCSCCVLVHICLFHPARVYSKNLSVENVTLLSKRLGFKVEGEVFVDRPATECLEYLRVF